MCFKETLHRNVKHIVVKGIKTCFVSHHFTAEQNRTREVIDVLSFKKSIGAEKKFIHPTAFVVKTLFTRLYALVDLLKPLKHHKFILLLLFKAGKTYPELRRSETLNAAALQSLSKRSTWPIKLQTLCALSLSGSFSLPLKKLSVNALNLLTNGVH